MTVGWTIIAGKQILDSIGLAFLCLPDVSELSEFEGERFGGLPDVRGT